MEATLFYASECSGSLCFKISDRGRESLNFESWLRLVLARSRVLPAFDRAALGLPGNIAWNLWREHQSPAGQMCKPFVHRPQR